MSSRSLSLIPCAAVLSASSALAGDVITVAASGPAEFTEIQDAVDAAVDGDTILVKSGSYAPFTIDGKGVYVVEDAGADVVITNSVRVQNVPAESRVILSGLRVLPPATSGPTMMQRGLTTQNNAGALRFFHCEFVGATGIGPTSGCEPQISPNGESGAVIASSSNVVFTQSRVRGGDGGDHPCQLFNVAGRGGIGLLLQNSTVAAHMTNFRAGDNGHGGDRMLPGSAGASFEGFSSGALFVAEGVVEGGKGTEPPAFQPDPCWMPGDGGPGIQFLAGGGVVQMLDASSIGGSGGSNPAPSCSSVHGANGPALAGSGSSFTFTVSAVGLEAPGVVRAGQSITLTVTGNPGDTVHLLEGSDTAFQNVPSMRGFLLVEREVPSRVKKLGVIPASGTLTRTYHAGNLPGGVDSEARYLQAYRTSGGGVTLGGFVPLVVVGAAF